MPARIWLSFLLCAAMSHRVAAYTNTNALLTTFPSDVPASSTEVDVSQNSLQEITASQLTSLTSLQSLVASDNQLTTFPDIRPVAASIQTVNLANNVITRVDKEHFDSATKLQVIDLSGNQLTIFPDFGDAKFSLTDLDFKSNPDLESVPQQHAIGLDSLQSLVLANCKVKTLPNIPWRDYPDMNLTINLGTTLTLYCDCLMRPWKLIAGHFSPDARCRDGPDDSVRFRYLKDLTMEQLVCPDFPDRSDSSSTKRFLKLQRVATGFYSPFPPVVAASSVSGADGCARLCANTDGCMDFNMRVSGESGPNCHVTSPLLPPAQVHAEGTWDYYSIIVRN